MRNHVNSDTVGGAGVIMAAFAAALVAMRFPAANGDVPGPAMFPLLIVGLWTALGIALLAVGLRGTRPPAEASTRRALALVALTTAYAALMPKLGFIASSALFLTLAVRILGYRHGWRAGALGMSIAFLVYGLFAGVMSVPLPPGWLG